MLGYFSLVGLLRLHSLLGDFYQAIKVSLESLSMKNPWSRYHMYRLYTVYTVYLQYTIQYVSLANSVLVRHFEA
jgi:hypothetical protein